MDWVQPVSTSVPSAPDVVQTSMAPPDVFAAMTPGTSETLTSRLPFGPTFPIEATIQPNSIPLPWDQKQQTWTTPNSFADASSYMLPPSFTSSDIHRSSSQPANKRRTNPMDWSTTHNSRDTLYAHEFLKAFRARMPDSAEGQAACDYCRKRKIKVCRAKTRKEINHAV